MDKLKIRLVCGTRKTREDFLKETALGRSLSLYSFLSILELRLFPENKLGLSTIYNQAIKEAKTSPAILVFVHDDVHLNDFYWGQRVLEGLRKFHLIGVAGNKRRVPKQPSWYFINDQLKRDDLSNLSGLVGHGKGFPCKIVSFYGAVLHEVKLLDGLFLAAHSKVFIDYQINFDEDFSFHFYDVDLCRQFEEKGLKMGTYPISLIHESGGNFGSESWRLMYAKYLKKWKE